MKRMSLMTWAGWRSTATVAPLEPVLLTDRLYFGKLPSRGDFVRSERHRPVIQRLDDWMTQTLERMSPDPRWKLIYDQASPLDFAILGMRGTACLMGHWQASHDASGRRFPFLLASVVQTPAPATVAGVAALLLHQEWSFLARVSTRALSRAESPSSPLASDEGDALAEVVRSLQLPDTQRWRVDDVIAQFADFLASHTVASAEQMLSSSAQRLSLRQAMLALGILLQPVLSQGHHRLGRVLQLPLSRDLSRRAELASFWLTLIAGFLVRGDAELGLFMGQRDGVPVMWVGFQGASAQTLACVLDPQGHADDIVTLFDAEWVEDCLNDDWGLRKLSNYLRDPGLSLQQAIDTFQEVFTGA